MVIGIIGGGASGMCAALAAAENESAQVVLFERQSRVGKKLLSTGNGRCNLTNMNICLDRYHGDAANFAESALAQFPVSETLAWFSQLGLMTVEEPTGRVYPYSDHANSVVDVLRFALNKPNIQVKTGCEVMKLRKTKEGFVVTTQEEEYFCNKVIVACGGLAGTKVGGSMAGYKLLKSMGHQVTRLRPSLVQLKSSWHGCVALKGVRANCRVQILRDNEAVAESVGELQFTEYGLSGPVIFEVSRDVCQSSGKWLCRLDFLPDVTVEVLQEMLAGRKRLPILAEDILVGILHNRLGRVLVAAAGIAGQANADAVTDGEVEELCRLIKGLEVQLTEPMGMDSAQVTAGGVITHEFDPATMESRLVPGLYACGEVLDIDGDCGGYNLQWAWSSGTVAGRNAGEVLV